MALIAPALLAADFARLGEAIKSVAAAGGRMIHLDVGDGHFSREVSMGQPVVESIRNSTPLELDVHLLIDRPERYVSDFAQAGADRLAVHPESTRRLWRTLELIRRSGAKAGVALEPGSSLSLVSELLGDIDFLSILIADPEGEPGLTAQPHQAAFQAGVKKLQEAARVRQQRGLSFELEAEGGVGPGNVAELAGAGADILVSGFAIFHDGRPQARLQELMAAVDRALASEPAQFQRSLISSNS